jgi:hypothetical protein
MINFYVNDPLIFKKDQYQIDAFEVFEKMETIYSKSKHINAKELLKKLKWSFNLLKKNLKLKKSKDLNIKDWVEMRYNLIITPTNRDIYIYWFAKFLQTQTSATRIKLILDAHFNSTYYLIDKYTFLEYLNGRILSIIDKEKEVIKNTAQIKEITEWIREKKKETNYFENYNLESNNTFNDDRIRIDLSYAQAFEYFEKIKIYDKKENIFTKEVIRNLILSNFKTTDYKSFQKIEKRQLIDTLGLYKKGFIKRFVYVFSQLNDDFKMEEYAMLLVNNFKVFNTEAQKKPNYIKYLCKKFSSDVPLNYPYELKNHKLIMK